MWKLVDLSFIAAMIFAAVKLIQNSKGWPDMFVAVLLIFGAFFYLICTILWEIGVRMTKSKKANKEEFKP